MKSRVATDLEKAEATLSRERDEYGQVAADLEQALAKREDLIDDRAAFERNEQTIHGLQSERLRRELVLARREHEVEQAKHRLAHANWREAGAELDNAYGERRKTSKAVADLLSKLVRATSELQAKREAVEQAEAKYQARAPTDVEDVTFPEGRDEPDWPEDPKNTLEVLVAGPMQPEADTAAAITRMRSESEARGRAAVRQAVRELWQAPSEAVFCKTPKHLHGRVWADFERDLETRLEQGGLNPEGRGMIEDRLKQVRERRGAEQGPADPDAAAA